MADTNPFWDFSLATYDRPGVAAACLALQDQCGLDVNLLLYAAFAAHCGQALDAADIVAIDQAVAEWRARVVQPLRQLRRDLSSVAGADSLRKQIQQLELDAEFEQQQRMWANRLPAGEWSAEGPADGLLEQNLDSIATAFGLAPGDFAEITAVLSVGE